jgi:hypothetical protein
MLLTTIRIPKHRGNSKYDKSKLVEEVGLVNRGYEITELLYATADDKRLFKNYLQPSSAPDDEMSNFMGFVAVCKSPRELERLGRRDIVVAWRGSATGIDFRADATDVFSPAGTMYEERSPMEDPVAFERGFLSVYKSSNENSRFNKKSARDQALDAVRKLVNCEEYKNEELSITVTGHSLGSALSMICAYDIAESGTNKRERSPKVPTSYDHPNLEEKHPGHDSEPLESRVPVSVISFAGPRVGNSGFKKRLEDLNVKVLRVVEAHDLVPDMPGVIFGEQLEWLHSLWKMLPDSYNHVGRELKVDSLVSQYVKDTINPITAHNLEQYLHLLTGYQGPNARFSPKVERDIALVNKDDDLLERRLGFPAHWSKLDTKVFDKKRQRWILTPQEAGASEEATPSVEELRRRMAQFRAV